MNDMRTRTEQKMAALGLTSTSLAKKMGKAQGTVWSFLSGRTKTFRDIETLARALDTTPQWLLTGKGEGQGLYDQSFYNTPEFSFILTTTMLMWAEHYKNKVPAEKVQEIAKQVYHEMREESPKAQKSSIKLLFESAVSA